MALKVALFATKGPGSNEEGRMQSLLAPLAPETLPFDRTDKRGSARRILRSLRRERPDVLVMEGTSVPAGAAAMAGRLLFGVPYVVSSGDAVGPFLGLYSPLARPVGELYERLLYRLSAGFVGWTPYLAGRALSLGAPCACTAENWSAFPARPEARAGMRERLGIPSDAIAFGIVGSLNWSRRGYCYGLELVRAIRRSRREDVVAVVVGDGDGLERLIEEAGDDLGRRVLLPGAVPHPEVPACLAAFDVASLPQSLDGVGSFRYTTKLSEYMDARLPVVTGRLPFAYDLDTGWLWRLPGAAPWDDEYVDALARLMEVVTADEIAARREAVPTARHLFDQAVQRARVSAFIAELV